MAVLAPDSRTLLLDALRPPSGHSLDRAVATTFTLDLAAALVAPLAFVGFRFDEQQDPIEVMEALRSASGRIDVFCQAGSISAERWPSDLLALLESAVHQVRRPRPGHVFHPKVWVLRFLNRSKDPFFRLLVLSRNLTFDRSWDTILWLDGRLGRRPVTGNAPLARFVAALPGLAVERLPDERREAIQDLAEDLRRVDWDLPDGVREAHFHPIGLPGGPRFDAEGQFSGYRRLVISPFVREGALQRIFRPRAGGTRGAGLTRRGAGNATVLDPSMIWRSTSSIRRQAWPKMPSTAMVTRPYSRICTPRCSPSSGPGLLTCSSARRTLLRPGSGATSSFSASSSVGSRRWESKRSSGKRRRFAPCWRLMLPARVRRSMKPAPTAGRSTICSSTLPQGYASRRPSIEGTVAGLRA